MNKYPIQEWFDSIQGEGSYVGLPVRFIRFGGCDYGLKACPFCFTKDHKVTMEDMTKKSIADLVIGDKIYGYNEETSRVEVTEVVNTMSRYSETISISFKDSNKVLKTTKEHPFLTYSGENKEPRVQWRSSLDMYKRKGEGLRNVSFYEIPYSHNEISLEYRKGYVRGYIEGDGCIYTYKEPSENAGRSNVKIVSIDDEGLDFIKESGKLFGLNFREVMHTGGLYGAKNRGLQITKQEEMGILTSLMDEPFTSDDYKRGYIAGLFDAEGSFDGVTLKISQNSQINADIFKRIKDIISYFRFSLVETPVGDNSHSGWRITGGIDEVLRFLFEFDPKILRKKTRMYSRLVDSRFYNALYLDNISENTEEEIVYNITTSLGTYLIDDIITHNCDSARASDSKNKDMWNMMTEDEIVALFEGTARDIILTGGNPLLYLENMPFLKKYSNRIHIETQGSKKLPWAVKHLVVSPKLEWLYENEEAKKENEKFWESLPEDQVSVDIKYPINSLPDFYALLHYYKVFFDKSLPFQLIATVRNDCTQSREWYAEKCKELIGILNNEDHPPLVLIQPQVHVLIWGNKEGV